MVLLIHYSLSDDLHPTASAAPPPPPRSLPPPSPRQSRIHRPLLHIHRPHINASDLAHPSPLSPSQNRTSPPPPPGRRKDPPPLLLPKVHRSHKLLLEIEALMEVELEGGNALGARHRWRKQILTGGASPEPHLHGSSGREERTEAAVLTGANHDGRSLSPVSAAAVGEWRL